MTQEGLAGAWEALREGRSGEALATFEAAAAGDAQDAYEEGNCPQPGGSAEEVYELFATSYGPTRTLAESLDEERRQELRAACVEVFAPHRRDGGIEVPREYLVVSGTRR